MASCRVNHVNRCIRSSPQTHDTARGDVLVYWNHFPGGGSQVAGAGVAYFLVEALLSVTGAFYSPHSRLGWRETDNNPGLTPGATLIRCYAAL